MATLARVFSIADEKNQIDVLLDYADTDLRAAIKARGYQWNSANTVWRAEFATATLVRAEAIALAALGLAFGWDSANRLAEKAAYYCIPLPLPVAIWGKYEPRLVSDSPYVSYAMTADGPKDGHLQRAILTSVAIGPKNDDYAYFLDEGWAVRPEEAQA